jgi:hypothetical protein
MLGFCLGVLFLWALPDDPPPAPPPAPDPVTILLRPHRMSEVEAVFDQWGQHAVWDNDTTEIALWNTDAKAFTDTFEVLRVGETLYFRTIPKLTRPVIRRGVESKSPLQFTGVPDQRP